MPTIFFSIVVVSLNPGKKLIETLESIAKQDYRNYEVIIKDGESKDGFLEMAEETGLLKRLNQFLVVRKKDNSIYDAMNQAVEYTSGKYLMFLNCGDSFYDEKVLQKMATAIEKQKKNSFPYIFYGDQYHLLQNCVVSSAPEMNDFACFRNVPCHQLCFYDERLFRKRAYNTSYRVRGDYEHFLYCIYEEKAVAVHLPLIICNYEGGGFSETPENRKRSKEEHREITNLYLKKKAVFYRLLMFVSMAGLRTKMAESKRFSGLYNKIKSFIYGNR